MLSTVTPPTLSSLGPPPESAHFQFPLLSIRATNTSVSPDDCNVVVPTVTDPSKIPTTQMSPFGPTALSKGMISPPPPPNVAAHGVVELGAAWTLPTASRSDDIRMATANVPRTYFRPPIKGIRAYSVFRLLLRNHIRSRLTLPESFFCPFLYFGVSQVS